MLKKIISDDAVLKMEQAAGLTNERFIWEKSKAFSIGRSGEGFIYLIEQDDQAREKTASALIDKLKSIVDPENNTRIARAVYRQSELFGDESKEIMPDIVIEPAEGYSFTGYYLQGEGLFHEVVPDSDFHIGKHHADGIIIAAGKGIEPQKGLHGRLIDIVPTLSYYMNLPITRDMDGKVLTQLFDADFINKNPQQQITDEQALPQSSRETVYSEQDEEKMKERLEDLGYL